MLQRAQSNPAGARTVDALARKRKQTRAERDARHDTMSGPNLTSWSNLKRDANGCCAAADASAPSKKTKATEPEATVQEVSMLQLQSMFGSIPDDTGDFAEFDASDDMLDGCDDLPQWARDEELMSALQDQGEAEDVFGGLTSPKHRAAPRGLREAAEPSEHCGDHATN